jgi:hypothetical protein
MYQKNIYCIDYKYLKKKGIKCLLFDLDNTCVPFKVKEPSKELKNLFNKLTKLGFKVIIFSNSPKKRLEKFSSLEVDYNAFSMKPFTFNFYKVLRKYGYVKDEVCIIGDQLFTDIYGGNRVGIFTCLVEPITDVDMSITNISRFFEGRKFRKWEQRKILKKGEYYNEM